MIKVHDADFFTFVPLLSEGRLGKGWEHCSHIHDFFFAYALVPLFVADCCDIVRCYFVCDAVWSGSNIPTFRTK